MGIISAVIVGAIIGVVARWVLPGKQHIGMLLTVGLGIIGALVGSSITNALTDGSAIITFVIGVVVAAVLIGVVDKMAIKR